MLHIEDLLAIPNESSITPFVISKTEFYSFLSNSFQILPDGQTIIGVRYKSSFKRNTLVKENITDPESSPQILFFTEKTINLVLFSEDYKILLVGDEGGNLHQLKFNANLNEYVKDFRYKQLNIGMIRNGVILGNLLVIGGTKSTITAIDVHKKEILTNPTRVPFGYVNSIQFCKLGGKNLLVTVVGGNIDYLQSGLDVFEIDSKEETEQEVNAFENKKKVKHFFVWIYKNISILLSSISIMLNANLLFWGFFRRNTNSKDNVKSTHTLFYK